MVEGAVGEAKVYKHWIPLVNDKLTPVEYLGDAKQDNFFIFSANGYPDYISRIESAIRDVENTKLYDRLVIAVDSEDKPLKLKELEIQNEVDKTKTKVDVRIVVQHFCLETWALGNVVMYARKPKNAMLREYLSFYNCRMKDPELLPSIDKDRMNRAQFAEIYLRRVLNEKHRNLTYSKNNPSALLHHKYFERLKDRYRKTGHIASFEMFLEAFL